MLGFRSRFSIGVGLGLCRHHIAKKALADYLAIPRNGKKSENERCQLGRRAGIELVPQDFRHFSGYRRLILETPQGFNSEL